MLKACHITRAARARGAEAAFIVALGVLGWIAGHALTYDLLSTVGILSGETHAHHVYLGSLQDAAVLVVLVAYVALVVATCRRWQHALRPLLYGQRSGLLAMVVPAITFVAAEYIERAGTHTTPPLMLLLVGVVVESLLGRIILLLARGGYRLADLVAKPGRRWPARCNQPLLRTAAVADSTRPRVLSTNLGGRAPPVARS